MFRKLLTIVWLMVIVCWLGCGVSSSDEPPFSFGEGQPGDLVRKTKLVDFVPAAQKIVYEVTYPAQGLTSQATLGGLIFKEIVREVFPGHWTVIYRYNDNLDRAIQLPNVIDIYRYTDIADNRGLLINTYKRGSISPPGKANYIDSQGREKTIDVSYFSIISN